MSENWTAKGLQHKGTIPSYRLWVNLGPELGINQSSAQITEHYTVDALINKQVICVCNFEPKRIAGFKSEILVTGFDTDTGVLLATTDFKIQNGTRLV